MHSFEANHGARFNFDNDMSPGVAIRPVDGDDDSVVVIDGPDLLEFARWYAAEYGPETPQGQMDWLWAVLDPTPVSACSHPAPGPRRGPRHPGRGHRQE